jgi:branched-chain amino acid transport system ATP-binding protein
LLSVEQNLLIGGFSGRPSRKVLNQRLERTYG